MPRRNPEGSIQARDRLAANVVALLERDERTVAWLARRMTAAGCPITTAALWKSLRRDREIRVNEWVAMAAALDVPMTSLIEAGGGA